MNLVFIFFKLTSRPEKFYFYTCFYFLLIVLIDSLCFRRNTTSNLSKHLESNLLHNMHLISNNFVTFLSYLVFCKNFRSTWPDPQKTQCSLLQRSNRTETRKAFDRAAKAESSTLTQLASKLKSLVDESLRRVKTIIKGFGDQVCLCFSWNSAAAN